MLKIYGADLSTPANKVRFVANALNLEYEYIRVRIRDGEHRKEEFLRLNPVGKIPVIDDNGFVLFESGAIIKYLARKHHSSYYPNDLKQSSLVDQWTDFVSLHIAAAMNRIVFNRLFAPVARVEVDERSIEEGVKFLARFLPVAENRFRECGHLAGQDMTLADFTLLAALDPAEVSGVDLSSYPTITAWRNRMKKEPFYTRCHSEYGEALQKMKK